MVTRNLSIRQTFLRFFVDGSPLELVSTFKYLGFIVCNTLKDDNDISRAMSKFYAEFNCLFRKFSFCDKDVKIFLFKQYCLQLYGCEMWFSCSVSSLKQFGIGYHKAIKKILNLSYQESNHYACQEAQLYTFKHMVNKCKIMAAVRHITHPCKFLEYVKDYFVVSSFFLKSISEILDNEYGIDSLLDNDLDAIIARITFIQNHEQKMRTEL